MALQCKLQSGNGIARLQPQGVLLQLRGMTARLVQGGICQMALKASKKSTITAGHPAVAQYYSLLKEFKGQRVKHEGAVSTAFENLLTHLAKQRGWIFIPLLSLKTGKRLVPDGTIRDGNGLPRGYWEAKDTDDDLDEEIAKKKTKGYPLHNIIFDVTPPTVLSQCRAQTLR